MSYHGDVRLGDTIDVQFTTRSFTTGAPTQLAGSPAVAAYVGNGTTEITAGITLTVDFDSRTGLNNVRVVATSGNGFATATNVSLVITAGTVGGVSVVGEVVGSFSIENRSAVMPTTGGRTLDVTATGGAGIDWGNVENQSTSVNLSATTTNLVNTATAVTNRVSANTDQLNGTSIAGTGTRVADSFVTLLNVASPVFTVASVNQTGDSFARIGATGSGLTSLAPSSTALSTAQWTNTLATNLGTTNSTVATNLDTTVSSRLAPTTSGRTLDVTATGAAGIDWGNVENQSTAVNLSATNIDTDQVVASVAGAVGSVTGNVGGNVVGSVGSISGVSFPTNFASMDINATGGVGVDWGNVQNPTTTLNLSGTTIKAVTDPVSGGTDLTSILGTAITEGAAGRLAGAFSTLLDVATPVLTVASVNQTGDSFGRIGATGSGLTSLAPSATALSTAQWTNTLATNLGTTNTTVASNLNATVTSRQATFTTDTGVTFPSNFSAMDINATGGVGVDWGNVQNPGTTVNLSGTTIKTVTDPISGGTDLTSILGTAITEGAAGRLAGAFTTLLDVATPVLTAASVNQTGDSFGRIGATGSGLTSLAPSATALSTVQWTNTLATNIATTNTTVAGTLDAAITTRAPASTALSTATWTNGLATNLATTNATVATNLNATVSSRASQTSVDDLPTNAEFAAAVALLSTSAQSVKLLAAVYDSNTSDGVDTLTLSDGATQQFDLTTGARTTTS